MIVLFLKVSLDLYPYVLSSPHLPPMAAVALQPNPVSEHECMWVRPQSYQDLLSQAVFWLLIVIWLMESFSAISYHPEQGRQMKVSGEAQCVAGCPVAQRTRNSMLMCSFHQRSCWFTTQGLQGGGGGEVIALDSPGLLTSTSCLVSECSHQSPSHTEGQICIHFICKWLPDSICMSHQI